MKQLIKVLIYNFNNLIFKIKSKFYYYINIIKNN